MVLKADFEKTREENTVAHRVHRFNKEKTTQIKRILANIKYTLKKNISSTLQTKLKLCKKYAHCKQKIYILQTKLPHNLQNQNETVIRYAHYKAKEMHAANKKETVKKLHTANKRITRCKLQTN